MQWEDEPTTSSPNLTLYILNYSGCLYGILLCYIYVSQNLLNKIWLLKKQPTFPTYALLIYSAPHPI